MMIDLYYWPTPNGHKVSIFLEEAALPYQIHPIHIGQGDQFAPAFLDIAPNNRIPAIVDHNPLDNNAPLSVFESGAILWYLAEKTGQFLPAESRHKTAVLQWLMWQMGGLGPMLGQNHHFRRYAPEEVPYAIVRYTKEAQRLYAVLNKQLQKQNSNFICGDYSIADMACYPWTVSHEIQGIDLSDYPHVQTWHATMQSRPAVMCAYEKGKAINNKPTIDEHAKQILFGQTTPDAPPQ